MRADESVIGYGMSPNRAATSIFGLGIAFIILCIHLFQCASDSGIDEAKALAREEFHPRHSPSNAKDGLAFISEAKDTALEGNSNRWTVSPSRPSSETGEGARVQKPSQTGLSSLSGVLIESSGGLARFCMVSLDGQVVLTSERGEFRFSHLKGSDVPLKLLARSDRSLEIAHREVLLPKGVDLTDLVFELERAPTVHGRVMSVTGESIEGALIHLNQKSALDTVYGDVHEEWNSKRFRGFQMEPGMGMGASMTIVSESPDPLLPSLMNHENLMDVSDPEVLAFLSMNSKPLFARSDETGSFQIAGVWPGPYTATVDIEHYLNVGTSLDLCVDSGDDVNPIAFSLTPSAVVKGHVFLDSGDAAEEVWVAAYFEGKLLVQTKSNRDGSFALEGLPTTTLDIYFREPSLKQVESIRGFVVRSGRVYTNVNGFLRAGGRIMGVVEDGVGTAVEGVQLEVRTIDGAILRTAESSHDGSYLIEELYDSEWSVSVRRDGYLPKVPNTRVLAHRGQWVIHDIDLVGQ